MLRELLGRLVRERHRLGRRGVADRDRGDRDARPAARPWRRPGASEIFCTTSSPSLTRPNTVNCPASAGCSVTHTKNCAPPLCGWPGRSAAPTAPRVNGSALVLRLAARRARPLPTARPLRRILRQRIPALDDAVPHHAMEQRVRVRPLSRQLHEVADVVRREVRAQIDHERARRGRRPPPACRSSARRSAAFERAGRRGRPALRLPDGRAVSADEQQSCRVHIRSIIGRLSLRTRQVPTPTRERPINAQNTDSASADNLEFGIF